MYLEMKSEKNVELFEHLWIDQRKEENTPNNTIVSAE